MLGRWAHSGRVECAGKVGAFRQGENFQGMRRGRGSREGGGHRGSFQCLHDSWQNMS